MKFKLPLFSGVHIFVAILFFFLGTNMIRSVQAEENKKWQFPSALAIQAWQEMRFGLFIHWGPVSLEGTEIGWSRGAQVPVDEYDQLYKKFDPVHFDANAWARMARDAGMKYLVITAKHHDGFCLWDSAYTDYDIASTPYEGDILKALSEACRQHGIKFCIYYSVCDWHHPDYPWDSPGGKGRKEVHNMPRYFQYVKDQTAELIKMYGPLGLLWFDGEWEEPWTREFGNELYAYLKELQPDLIINNRVSKGRHGMAGTTLQSDENAGDYDTPEQRIGGFKRQRPWETCMTLCRQWAWKPDDEMKPLSQCIRTLLQVVGGDGNFLFNVGPMPDGCIEPRQLERLGEMGAWLKKYGQTVYGTRGGPFKPGRWGASTCRDDKIWLFVFPRSWESPFKLPIIDTKILSAKALTGGKVKTERNDEEIFLHMQSPPHTEIATVIELTVTGSAFEIEPVFIYPDGRPIPIRSACASNVYKDKEEHAAARAIDNDDQTRWATDTGTRTAWLEVDLGEACTLRAARILEAYAGRIEAFELQFLDDSKWKTFHSGYKVDADTLITFEPVTVKKVRLKITEATEGPTIWEFQLFNSV